MPESTPVLHHKLPKSPIFQQATVTVNSLKVWQRHKLKTRSQRMFFDSYSIGCINYTEEK